jgi:large subunit ribosomal protein L10
VKREEKEELVGSLSELFKAHQVGFLVDFKGMTVESVTDLRRKLYGAKTRMRVIRNRQAKIAARGTPFEPMAAQMNNTRAFVFGADPVAPAKVILKYASDNEKFKIVTGVLVNRAGAGELLDPKQIKVLGSLPPRDELIAKLLYVMKAPQTNFVRTLAAVRDQKQAAG